MSDEKTVVATAPMEEQTGDAQSLDPSDATVTGGPVTPEPVVVMTPNIDPAPSQQQMVDQAPDPHFYVGCKVVEAYATDKDGQPGYAVRYPDGYVSWCPQEAFEEAYLDMGHDEGMAKRAVVAARQLVVDLLAVDLATLDSQPAQAVSESSLVGVSV